jgi:TIR domain
MSFVFFTSYARDNKTHYLEKFVRELSQQVLDKTNFPPEQIGFFDGSNIETGQDWVRVLGDALRTCKVIVCLCTPRSLNSQFCGKEMQVFLLRRENWLQQPGNENKKAGIVFPVIWERPAGALPKALEKFQFTDNALPRKYVEKGLNALSQVSRERDNFRTVVITLAERIRDAVNESALPEWPQLPPFDEIPSIFHADASTLLYQYGVVFLHNQGRTWCPFGDAPVSTLPDAVAAQTNRLCREIVAGPDLA